MMRPFSRGISRPSIVLLFVSLFGLPLLVADATYAQADPPDLWEEVLLPGLEALSNGDAAWGDYDGDGDLDLFYSGNSGTFTNPVPVTQLYLNEGETVVFVPDPNNPGTSIETPAIDYVEALDPESSTITDMWRSAVAWGDYDNDGRLDLLASGLLQNGIREIWLYRNVPGLDRLEAEYFFPGVSEGDAAWGDYDNDGDLDFVVSGLDDAGTAVTHLFENRVRDQEGFVQRDSGIVGLGHSSVAWGDYDNDQDLDLLVSGNSQPQRFVTAIYRNDGDGSFSEVSVDLGGLFATSVAWGDGDADGDLDILMSGAELNPFLLEGKLLVYENTGGTFSQSNLTILGRFEGDAVRGRYSGSAAWGDFDNDGIPDFFINGLKLPFDATSGQTYQSLGNQTYVKSRIGFRSGLFSGAVKGATIWGDYDNDNDLDLFVSGSDLNGNAVIRVLRNYLPFYPRNRLPQPPGFLTATVTGNFALLSWSPGNDGFNPAAALSYNLRVGTAPGAGDIMSPMASGFNGRRLVAALGNAQQNLSWSMRDLAPGTYYWTVQTIDTSYKGSEFSVESTFTILSE